MLFFAACLAAVAALTTPTAYAQNVEFCTTGVDCAGDPTLEDVGFGMTITGAVAGLGAALNNGGVVRFRSGAFGFLDEVCFNNGSFDAPGQNKDVPILEGATTGSSSDASNGSLGYSITSIDDCSCGVEDGSSFEIKEKGQIVTKTCPGDVPCCLGEDPDDSPDIGCPLLSDGVTKCDCRVGLDFKTCPNSSKRWDQYVVGIRYDQVVIDAALFDSSTDTIPVELQRQVCVIAGEGSDDGVIPAGDVSCVQCEPCGDKRAPQACTASYETDYPLDEGCPIF